MVGPVSRIIWRFDLLERVGWRACAALETLMRFGGEVCAWNAFNLLEWAPRDALVFLVVWCFMGSTSHFGWIERSVI